MVFGSNQFAIEQFELSKECRAYCHYEQIQKIPREC